MLLRYRNHRFLATLLRYAASASGVPHKFTTETKKSMCCCGGARAASFHAISPRRRGSIVSLSPASKSKTRPILRTGMTPPRSQRSMVLVPTPNRTARAFFRKYFVVSIHSFRLRRECQLAAFLRSPVRALTIYFLCM
jgi:hypothetical protein